MSPADNPPPSSPPPEAAAEAPKAPSRILVVEDDEAIAQGLMINLESKGWAPERVVDGPTALERARDDAWDLILLDVRLPGGLDGFDVCQRLRQEGNFTPILMLTARNQPDDVIFGLKLGADDYVVKPFDLAELLARVESLLRRRGWTRSTAPNEGPPGNETPSPGADPAPTDGSPTAPATDQRFHFGDFWVDFGSFQAQTRGGVTELSQKEIAVMKLFAERPNQVIPRREMLAEVWELPDHPNTRVVDNVILSLRKAFEESSWRPAHIHSVRGVGYRFTP